MSVPQFRSWRAFDIIEPIGGRRGDWQVASICAEMWNTLLARAGSKRRVKVADFLLKFKEATSEGGRDQPAAEPAAPDWRAMKFVAQQMVALANAEQKKGRKRAR